MDEDHLIVESEVPTGHEPHAHAHSRLLIGIVAIVCVLIVGVVWARWGTEIKQACTGNNGACKVDLPPEPPAPPLDDQVPPPPGNS